MILSSFDELTDKNIYSYCDNNPIIRVDENGKFWHVIVGAAVGAVISGVTSIISQKITTGTVDWKEVAISSAAGAISGAIVTTGIGAVGAGVINAAVSGIEYMAIQTLRAEDIDDAELFSTMFVASVTAGKGLNCAKQREIYKVSNQVLRTTSSSTKKAIYGAKKSAITEDILKEIGGDILEGIFSIATSAYDFDMFDTWRQ